MKNSDIDTNFVCPWCFSKLSSEAVLFKKIQTLKNATDFCEPWREKVNNFSLAFGVAAQNDNKHTFFSYSKNCGYTPVYVKSKKSKFLMALFEQQSGSLFTDRYCRFCFNKLPQNYGIKKSKNLVFMGTSDCNVVSTSEAVLSQIVKSKIKGIKVTKKTNKLETSIYKMKLSHSGKTEDVYITAYPYILDNERYKNVELSSEYRDRILERISYNCDGIMLFTKLNNAPAIEKLRLYNNLPGFIDGEGRSKNCLELEQRESIFRVTENEIPVIIDILDREFLNSVSKSYPDSGIKKVETVECDMKLKNLIDRIELNKKIAYKNMGIIDPFYRGIIDKCFANRHIVETSSATENAEVVMFLLRMLDLL